MIIFITQVSPKDIPKHVFLRQMAYGDDLKFAVLVSANAEWAAVKPLFPGSAIERSPYGEYFFQRVGGERVFFFHGGLGKVAAAASTQYVIDHFQPANLINLGTCGGVEGRVGRFDIVVPDTCGWQP